MASAPSAHQWLCMVVADMFTPDPDSIVVEKIRIVHVCGMVVSEQHSLQAARCTSHFKETVPAALT